MAGAAAHDDPFLGVTNALFARDGDAIVRIDASSGRITARRRYRAVGDIFSAVIAGGVLWLSPATAADGTATLQGFEPITLTPAASIRLHFRGPTDTLPVASLAGAPDGRRLYVGLGHTVNVVDPTTRRVINRFPTTGGYLLDVAVSADGARLYVAAQSGEMSSTIEVLNASDGTRLLTRPSMANIVNNIGLIASAGGLWLHTGSGMSDQVDFLAGTDLVPLPTNRAIGVGGRPITVTLGDNTVWIGASNRVVCADPVTGGERASTELAPRGGSTAILTDLHVAGGHLFGYYQAGTPNGSLLRLDPPKACSR